MIDVVKGAFFKNDDIEQLLEKKVTIIKQKLGLSNAAFDRGIRANLDELNQLFGIRFVLSGQFYRQLFNELTEDYIIWNKSTNTGSGSIFSVKQSLDRDYENLQLREGMTWRKLEFSDTYICFHLFAADAYNLEGRAHRKITVAQRANLGALSVSQMAKHWLLEGCYDEDDSNKNQKENYGELYDQFREV